MSMFCEKVFHVKPYFFLISSGSKENSEEVDLIKNYAAQDEFPVQWQEISDVCSEYVLQHDGLLNILI